MKAKYTKREPEFSPVKLEITIESKAELDFLGSLFNHVAVNNAARNFGALPSIEDDLDTLYLELSKSGSDIHRVDDLKLKSE